MQIKCHLCTKYNFVSLRLSIYKTIGMYNNIIKSLLAPKYVNPPKACLFLAFVRLFIDIKEHHTQADYLARGKIIRLLKIENYKLLSKFYTVTFQSKLNILGSCKYNSHYIKLNMNKVD